MIESQRQAYLNEFKGNLFEYLVGRNLAQHFGIERKFLESLHPETQKFLNHYEKELRILDPSLPANLANLAEVFTLKIIENKRMSLKSVESIYLVGKVKEGFSDIDFQEADIVIVGEGKVLPLSIKLVKNQSFVNTKSAGVRTFFRKYFDNEQAQDEVNQELDVIYESMARSLHQNHDFEYTGTFEQWIENGLPELPGQLESEDKKSLHKSYQEISNVFYKRMKVLSQKNQFTTQLQPLLGKGDGSLIQALCFHNGTQEYKYCDHHIDFPEGDQSWSLGEEEVGNSSIHLHGKDKVFQIRIKPMNKFTVPSFKVNCSVKYL